MSAAMFLALVLVPLALVLSAAAGIILTAMIGGLPPPRPDQVFTDPGAPMAPGAQSSTVRARLVLIYGPAAGLFIYNGTPSSSNPPIFSATDATVDPFGNAVVSGGAASYGTDGISFLADGAIFFGPTPAPITGNYAAGMDGAVAGQATIFSGGQNALDPQAEIILASKATGGGKTQCNLQAQDVVFGTSAPMPNTRPSITTLGSTWNATTAGQANANFSNIINFLIACGISA